LVAASVRRTVWTLRNAGDHGVTITVKNEVGSYKSKKQFIVTTNIHQVPSFYMATKKTAQVATVQSLDRGLAIVQAIANSQQPMSLGQVAELMGIDRSTAFRLLHTLKRRGFLAMPAGRKDYILGSSIWTLYNHYSWSKMLVKVASGLLKELATLTNETAHIAIREGSQALFMDCAAASHMVAVSSRIGELLPLYCTAHGKALLADVTEKDLKKLYGNRPLKKLTESTLSTVPELMNDIAGIKKRGYAVDDAEFRDEIRCIAAPIRLNKDIVGSIGISAPVLRVTKENTRLNIEHVCSIATRIGDVLSNLKDED
jgi:DNA-binding IclR family transcriptional regulator